MSEKPKKRRWWQRGKKEKKQQYSGAGPLRLQIESEWNWALMAFFAAFVVLGITLTFTVEAPLSTVWLVYAAIGLVGIIRTGRNGQALRTRADDLDAEAAKLQVVEIKRLETAAELDSQQHERLILTIDLLRATIERLDQQAQVRELESFIAEREHRPRTLSERASAAWRAWRGTA